MSEYKGRDRRKFTRSPLENQLEFYVDEDVVEGTALDHSPRGIRIETGRPVRIFLRTTLGGELIEREAEIVWAERREDGVMAYGFEYVPLEEGNL